MSIQYAQEIVQRLGPGRYHLDRARHEGLARELALMGCDVSDLAQGDGGTAILDWPDDGNAGQLIARLQGFDTLVLRCPDGYRPPVDTALFGAGWRRHPAGMLAGQCGGWSDVALPETSYYQRAPADAAEGPLRATGQAADAAIARFAQMSDHVRAGDHVLIDSADGADGATILSAISRGARFSVPEPVATGPEQPFRLDAYDDNSIDLVIAFSPPADNWQIALAEYARVLRFDGRLIVGWPIGGDPERQPGTWQALTDFAQQLFILEGRYAQFEAGRALFRTDLDAPGSEWLILMACDDPRNGEGQSEAYVHPGFPASDATPVLVDFARGYDNPWLYRAMVQMGERIADQGKLAALAEAVLAEARADSADEGAAIAVLGYRILESRMASAVPALLPFIDNYMAATGPGMRSNDANAHVARWRLSLAFLAGRLCELAEDRTNALRWYDEAAAADWSAFSPILATKTVSACFHAGRLCLANGDRVGAQARFRAGVSAGQRVAAADHGPQIGDPERPLPFYFQELAEVIDMAAQCANALFHMPLWDRDPGLYWRQVDVRRFGLASWALDLERENDRLRRMR